MLLLGGACPNTSDWDRAPLLSQAIVNHDMPNIQLLLDFACDVNETSDTGRTPLHEAAQYGTPEMVGILLASGATPNHLDNEGDSPLMCAVRNGNPDIIELVLIEANTKVINRSMETPLHVAVLEENAKAVDMLIKAKVPLDVISYSSNTPLSVGIKMQNLLMVDKLLEAGAAVHIPMLSGDFNQVPVLHEAAELDQCDIIDSLVRHGARLNTLCPNTNLTPLQMAVVCKHPKAVCKLLQYNCDPNLSDPDSYIGNKPKSCKNTVLHQAIFKKQYVIIKMLLLAGAKFVLEDLTDILEVLFTDIVVRSNPVWLSTEGKLREIDTLRSIMRLPYSLKQVARLAVRNSVGVCLPAKIQQLELPKAIQDFVMLKELEELC